MIPVWKFKFYFGNCRRIIKELKLIMRDTYVHKGKRKQLIDYLHQKIGITDSFVLNAMNEVPRHLFIESVFEDYAYEDRAFPIAAKQTISHPSTVAEQTELLEVSEGEKILEIGTGLNLNSNAITNKNFNLQDGPNWFGFQKTKIPANATTGYHFTNSFNPQSKSAVAGGFNIKGGKSYKFENGAKFGFFATAAFDNSAQSIEKGLAASVNAEGAYFNNFKNLLNANMFS